MDTLTHALSGALLARATAPAEAPGGLALRTRMQAGFLAAAFPDSDIVLRIFGALPYLDLHRGVTHSILLLPFWAWLLAWILSRFWRRRYGWRAFYGTAALGIAIHIAGDIFTAYGTMVLAPFSHHRFSLPFTFIIDLYFSAIIAAGLLASAARPPSRFPAIVALAALGCYVGFQGVLHSRAVEAGEAYAASRLPARAKTRTYAFPQPLSPFYWRIVVVHEEEYHVASVDLGREQDRDAPEAGHGTGPAAHYRPIQGAAWAHYRKFGADIGQAAWAREAWGQTVFSRYRDFALLPFLDRVESTATGTCAWFLDLRFILPALPPSLGYGVCREDATGLWHAQRMTETFGIDTLRAFIGMDAVDEKSHPPTP